MAPSRVKKPWACAAGALRGAPSPQTRTVRRARPSTSAALKPATPPPAIDDTHDLEEGDAFYFVADAPHRFDNIGAGEARYIGVGHGHR